MTPAPISVERLSPAISDYPGNHFEDAEPIMVATLDGEYVRHSDYAALLQQLAETERDRDEWKARESFAVSDLQRELRQRDAKLAEREAEVERLRSFAQDVMDSWPGGDVDGGYLQEVAENRGLLVAVEAIVPCGENCGCAEFYSTGDTANCYRKTTLLTGDSNSDERIAAFLAASGGG